MKKIIALSVLALALTGCAAKEEEAAPAPAVDCSRADPQAPGYPGECAEGENGGVPQDTGEGSPTDAAVEAAPAEPVADVPVDAPVAQ